MRGRVPRMNSALGTGCLGGLGGLFDSIYEVFGTPSKMVQNDFEEAREVNIGFGDPGLVL